MEFEFYIIAQAKAARYGPRRGELAYPGSVRVAKKKPSVSRDEVAVKMSLVLPDALFNKPSLSARIEVEDGSAPGEITAEAMSSIEAIIEDQTGMVVRLINDNEEN